MASGGGKATASSWAAAMSMGAGTVEALKERHAGLCRWNYHALRCVQQRAGTAAAGNGKTMAAPAAGGAAARRRNRGRRGRSRRRSSGLSCTSATGDQITSKQISHQSSVLHLLRWPEWCTVHKLHQFVWLDLNVWEHTTRILELV
ncbi:hypothetical protein CFC21_099262 [Triticum aestivum]|uniref:Uncharacterized protein n=2 Tax=Triticum aestivum TaxID=4565 RepID=A0A3B6B7C6_WHEAT|nr:hypothetical protein CFC21_099262 [Triticum aestivum]